MSGRELTREQAAELLVAHLEVLEATVRNLWWARGLPDVDREDFASELKLLLIEDDYAIVRSFRHESQFSTYLISFIRRQFHRHCRQLRGHWRPSRAAQDHGVLGIRMERLIHRDGRTLDEAIRTLRISFGYDLTHLELLELWGQLPHRAPLGRPQTIPLPSELELQPGSRHDVAGIRRELVALLRQSLQDLLDALETEQRLIVRLLVEDALLIPSIARLVDSDRFRLYRRVKVLFEELKKELKEAGIGTSEVALVLCRPLVLDDELVFEIEQADAASSGGDEISPDRRTENGSFEP